MEQAKKYEENRGLNIKKFPQPLIVEADELYGFIQKKAIKIMELVSTR